ncbi:hypothetical protein Q2318_26875, partial [Escherichia coli]|nr:hypothetical protein [Escherichia coli]
NEVYEKFNKTAMTPFPNLSDTDINDILAYTSNPPAPAPAAGAAATGTAQDQNSAAALEEAKKQSTNSKILIISLLVIAGLLIWLLMRLRQLVKL